MPDIELSYKDWLELYAFLLDRLESKGLLDIRRDIETAATASVLEQGDEYEDARVLREFKGRVGQRALRRRAPSEVFSTALDVLWTRLVEFPRVVIALQKNLGGAGQSIEFRVDYDEQYAPSQSDPISLDRLRMTASEQSAVLETFTQLGVSPERTSQQ